MSAFSSSAFATTAFSTSAFDFGTAPVVVGVPPAGGGRRLRNEDEDRKRVKTRPLTRQERRELDRLFRGDEPAPVSAPAPKPRAPAPLPLSQPEPAVSPITPAAWVEKARHVAALDSIAEYLQRVPRTVATDARRRAYQRAVEAAQRAEQEQQQRLVQYAAEQERIQMEAAAAAERQRQADEDEMMAVLLAIHEII